MADHPIFEIDYPEGHPDPAGFVADRVIRTGTATGDEIMVLAYEVHRSRSFMEVGRVLTLGPDEEGAR